MPIISPSLKLTIVPIPLHRKKLQKEVLIKLYLSLRGFCQETGYYLEPEAIN